ncbi:MAG TPA: porin [Vicinamibacterales bacterium]|jgi:phosphate-selective porin OprO/OprP|nr:porin [Vicinamibacterales bacterium]
MSSVIGRTRWRPVRWSKFILALGVAIAAAAAAAAPAYAQSAAAAPAQASTPAPAASAAPPFTAGWQNGFIIQSANGDNRLQFGVVVQADGKFTTDDPPAFTDTFTIRKARPGIQGRVAKYFDFRLTPELGNGSATVVDAYIDTRFSSAFRIRTGKDKTPVGLELLYGDPGLLFPERSLLSSLVPNRDVGVQAQGDLAGGKLSYAGGVFNGINDGSSSTTDVDTNNGKDLAGRVLYQPFRGSKTHPALANLGFHIGGSTGKQSGTSLPSFKTSAGQTYFSYNGASAAGDRTRVSPAFFYYYSVVGVFAEYARTSQDISKSGVTRTVTNDGWDVTGTIILTGETASSGVIQPKKPFDPAAGHFGAAQAVARYAELHVDQDAFDAGFAASNASQKAKQTSIGVNWYPVSFVKYYLAYEHTSFSGGADRPAENSIILRTQLAF